MPSPFPGMDPYLEQPDDWPGFYAGLAAGLTRNLNQQLPPTYYSDISVLFASDYPDLGLATKLRAVHIYHMQTRQLVTTIELLSPYNRRIGSSGITEYRLKRAQILASHVHLVEIDLLRGGERPGLEFIDEPIDTDYILLVNRFRLLERLSEIWPVALNEPLPVIPIPLLPPDPDIPLNLNVVIAQIYVSSRYDSRIKYQLPVPPPPLRAEMQAWIAALLTERTTKPG